MCQALFLIDQHMKSMFAEWSNTSNKAHLIKETSDAQDVQHDN